MWYALNIDLVKRQYFCINFLSLVSWVIKRLAQNHLLIKINKIVVKAHNIFYRCFAASKKTKTVVFLGEMQQIRQRVVHLSRLLLPYYRPLKKWNGLGSIQVLNSKIFWHFLFIQNMSVCKGIKPYYCNCIVTRGWV